jgi:hypothetical protein
MTAEPTHGRDGTGTPGGYRCLRLLFCKRARILVAQLAAEEEGNPHRVRVFARSTSDAMYQELPYDGDPTYSYDHLAMDSDSPLLLINQWRWNGKGYDWCGVLRCDLAAMTITTAIAAGQMAVPGAKRQWISDLLDVENNGGRLWCVVAQERSQGTATQVTYELGSMELDSLSFTPTTVLKGAFL